MFYLRLFEDIGVVGGVDCGVGVGGDDDDLDGFWFDVGGG